MLIGTMRSLRCIYDKSDIGRVADGADGRHRLDRPKHVRAVVDHHKLGILANSFLDIIGIDKTGGIEPHESRLLHHCHASSGESDG